MPGMSMRFVVYQKENRMWSWKAMRGGRVLARGEREFKVKPPAVQAVSSFIESVERNKRRGATFQYDDEEEGE